METSKQIFAELQALLETAHEEAWAIEYDCATVSIEDAEEMGIEPVSIEDAMGSLLDMVDDITRTSRRLVKQLAVERQLG